MFHSLLLGPDDGAKFNIQFTVEEECDDCQNYEIGNRNFKHKYSLKTKLAGYLANYRACCQIFVDRLLRDIVGNNIPFGGKTFLLGGDFRQTLPVVKKANAAQIVEQCILRSPLWPFSPFSIFPVTTW